MTQPLKFKSTICSAFLALMLLQASNSGAQTRKDVFQTGEQLIYKVKFGFVKLGTLSIRTGGSAGQDKVNAKMQFATADVPFLDTKSTINDVIDTRELYITHFEQLAQDGDKVTKKKFDYDKAAKTLTYTDNTVTNEVTQNVSPFADALTLVYEMRTWSASGKTYSFLMKSKDGNKPVVCHFTNKTENIETPALDDKEVRCRVIEGQADMGGSSPLGANGAFTAYISDDEAAIPVQIDMKIAIGSITLLLDKVQRNGWTAAK